MKKIKSIKYSSFILASLLACSSCEGVFEPEPELQNDLDYIASIPVWMADFNCTLYTDLPFNTGLNSDKATSDAVSTSASDEYSVLSGNWTASKVPGAFDKWSIYLSKINYINLFIANVGDKTPWTLNENTRKMYDRKYIAEAKGLRGLFGFYLLKLYAGKAADGNFYGYPVFTTEFSGSADFNLPRNSVRDCANQIIEDLDDAISVLPWENKDIASDDDIPESMRDLITDSDTYNTLFGNVMMGRLSGRICSAIKTQLMLMLASPFMEGCAGYDYEAAAKAAGEFLKDNGGVAGLDPKGNTWYLYAADYNNGANPAEVIWRRNRTENADLEKSNLPPTLQGQGQFNPTKNLVDAFGMANGYPITASASGYDRSDPFAGRDPRLADYILYDGNKWDGNVVSINGTNNAIGMAENSSRTGFYLKKLLVPGAGIDKDNKEQKKFHFETWLRATEIYLDYAEAANEAWGPKGDGGFGFSAYDVIKAIRLRGGVGKDGDAYLESCAGNTDEMRKLIRNERRIELCFENHRFYDLRRWNDIESLNEKALNVNGKVANEFNYKDYMIYNPLPQNELLKWDNLAQNAGWE